jgi:hypothetical protein
VLDIDYSERGINLQSWALLLVISHKGQQRGAIRRPCWQSALSFWRYMVRFCLLIAARGWQKAEVSAVARKPTPTPPPQSVLSAQAPILYISYKFFARSRSVS